MTTNTIPHMRLHALLLRFRRAARLLLFATLASCAAAPATPLVAQESAEAPAAPTPPIPDAPPSPLEPPVSTRENDRRDKRSERREIVAIGNDARLPAGERARSMVAVFGDTLIDGVVSGESVTVFGSVLVNGRVEDDLVCVFGTITLGPDASVGGDLVSIFGGVEAAPTATVGGERVRVGFPLAWSSPRLAGPGQWISEGLLLGRPLPHARTWAWIAAGFLLLLNLAVYAIFRRPLEAAARALEEKPALSLVNGMLAVLLFGPLTFLLMVTMVGLLLVPFAIAGMFLAAFGGYLAVYRDCGARLGLREAPFAALFVGNVVFTLLYAVPVIGFAVLGIAGVLGIGAVLTALVERLRVEARRPGRPQAIPTTQPDPAATALVARDPAPLPEPTALSAPSAPGERVGFWPRFGATALDFLLVGGLSTFLGILFLFPYLWLGYHIAFWAWRSTTIGGVVFNLRIERLDGGRMDPGIAAVRSLGAIFSGMVLGLGFMWAGWDEQRQSWHDKIAGTTIVRVPPGRSLL